MSRERIERELAQLHEGGQVAEILVGDRECVLYRDVPTDGPRFGLSATTDVIVPVPSGYPAAMIDLAGLPVATGTGSSRVTTRTTAAAGRHGIRRVTVSTPTSVTSLHGSIG